MEYIISGEWIETMNLALDKLEMRLNPHECPRVIRCRDCKNHLYRIGGFCLRWCEETPGHWYCSEAEPKEGV